MRNGSDDGILWRSIEGRAWLAKRLRDRSHRRGGGLSWLPRWSELSRHQRDGRCRLRGAAVDAKQAGYLRSPLRHREELFDAANIQQTAEVFYDFFAFASLRPDSAQGLSHWIHRRFVCALIVTAHFKLFRSVVKSASLRRSPNPGCLRKMRRACDSGFLIFSGTNYRNGKFD